MPGPILHLGASVLCAHGGVATPTVPFPRVLVSGQPVVTLTTPYVISGCALSTTSSPPCVTGQWVVGATRVLAGGAPVVITTGSSVTVAPGTPMLPVAFQVRAAAT